MISYRQNFNGSKSRGYCKLTEILETALDSEADSVTLEYADGGLEVCFMFGNVGGGGVLVDRELEEEVVGCIVSQARLENKPRGKMKMQLRGVDHTIVVREYDSFGESAFELKIGEMASKSRKAKRKTRT